MDPASPSIAREQSVDRRMGQREFDEEGLIVFEGVVDS